ncbi:MAG: ABC transporter permease, partial [Pseudomonadota bacterium]|nr:ABC transporter permease [Pseudomonadota bacterium]
MTPPLSIRLALREILHNRTLLATLGLAVAAGTAALVAIGALGERVERALSNETAALLGGDIKVSARRDLRSWAEALPEPLRPSLSVIEMPTMAVSADAQRLVELKAVGSTYPLYGELRVSPQGKVGPPPPGSVWVEPGLLQQLALKIGDTIGIGYAKLQIAGTITREPDRAAGAFSIGPRVMLSAHDLPATGLIQPGSRIETILLYRVSVDRVTELQQQLESRLPPGAGIETTRTGIEQTRGIISQTADYLRLTALAGLILAAAAVLVAVEHLAERSAVSVATLKAMGADSLLITTVYTGVLGMTALAGGGIGVTAGQLIQSFLPKLLGDLLPADLPVASHASSFQGITTALAITLAAGGYQLWRLARTSPIGVLRAPPEDASRHTWVQQTLILLAGLGLLIAWLSNDAGLILIGMSAILAALLVTGVCTVVLLRVLPKITNESGITLRHAVLGLSRGGPRTVIAITALALSVTALLAPLLVRADLVRQWLIQAPADAPNHFLIDVQPTQRDDIEQILARHGATGVWLRPMVRARLTHLDGVPIREVATPTPRAERMATRENNLTFGPPEPDNELVAGSWWRGQPAQPEISLEQEWAELFGLSPGSTMSFEVAGNQVTGTVTSVRRVNWESMRSNFFVVFSPGALDDFPRSYITSYRIPADRAQALQTALLEKHPNVTVIDLGVLVATVQEMV